MLLTLGSRSSNSSGTRRWKGRVHSGTTARWNLPSLRSGSSATGPGLLENLGDDHGGIAGCHPASWRCRGIVVVVITRLSRFISFRYRRESGTTLIGILLPNSLTEHRLGRRLDFSSRASTRDGDLAGVGSNSLSLQRLLCSNVSLELGLDYITKRDLSSVNLEEHVRLKVNLGR